ncbi:MAG: nickel-dependent lactate racemase [Lachnospiraceae bacterium]
MKLSFGFGTTVQEAEVADKNVMGVLHANEVNVARTGEAEVQYALRNPIGCGTLSTVVKPGEKIAIITSDITRPLPSYVILPSLLDELYEAGIQKEDITIVFGLGSHRKHTKEEMTKLVGERAFSEVACVDSEPSDCIKMGVTSSGTVVDITRSVASADRRICLGNIEYHYFAGYSGGAKAIMPGVSNRAAIQSNHSMMVRPEACAGKLDGNPIRIDIEEAGEICGIDFIVNVVLDEHKKVIKAVAGDCVLAHREGCAFLDTLYRKELPERADIVIVSQGGAPKDLNLYQTQKALDNAKHAIKDGGIIILVGSCIEGLGEETFEEWMTQSPSPASMVERIKVDFQLGGHKAAAIAMVLEHAQIYLVSDLEDEFVRDIFLQPMPSVQKALDEAFAQLGDEATVLAMPFGGSTLPHVS